MFLNKKYCEFCTRIVKFATDFISVTLPDDLYEMYFSGHHNELCGHSDVCGGRRSSATLLDRLPDGTQVRDSQQ